MSQTSSAPTSFQADISRIIKYAPSELIGREAETKLLADAWAQAVRGETPRPHVITFVALGGEGKTSLVAKWAADLAHRNWPGCDTVFAWSFYSQGTREQLAASSDVFLKEALTFFGDPALAGNAAGAFDKGRRLAQLVGERRALLILDGLEPLQCAPTSPTPGALKDQGVAKLLKDLATNNRGLCIVTTRVELRDLQAFKGGAVNENHLRRLSRDAGVHLLKVRGVTGSDRRNISFDGNPEVRGTERVSEFEKLVEDVDGHALTLHIMGSFLKKAFRGDIRCRDRVTFEKASQKTDDHHAFRAMAAYEKWMEDGSDEAKRELAILRAMGLFDRPATAGCLQALLAKPAIPGLTEPLIGLPEDDWNCSLDSLETAKLVTVNRDAAVSLDSLDAHPLLREYFSRQLHTHQPDAWRAAHRRLYEHLRDSTEFQPSTFDALQPLYQAVAHGCQAGLYEEAFWDVYWARIFRGETYYPSYRFGPFATDVSTLGCFVEGSHSSTIECLQPRTKALVLRGLGYALRPLGRTLEAVTWMEKALSQHEASLDWRGASTDAGILCVQYSAMGVLDKALAAADKGVSLAHAASCPTEIFDKLGIRGQVLLQLGRIEEAQQAFDMMSQVSPLAEHPQLQLIRLYACYRRLELAIALREQHAIEVSWASCLNAQCQGDSAYEMAVLHLCHARTLIYEIFPSAHAKCDETVMGHLDKAVFFFRASARLDAMPLALFERAMRWSQIKDDGGENADMRRCNNMAKAQADLDEAWEISQRGSMQLHLADIHLHRASLFFREQTYPWNKDENGNPRDATTDLAASRKLMEQCGYWRRRKELEDGETAIGLFRPN